MTGKGTWGGECGTPGCTRPARWIAWAEVRQYPDVVYRCVECCEAVDAAWQEQP